MINFIYVEKPLEKGSGLVACNMQETYPDLFTAYKFPKLPKTSRFWILHNPKFYDYPLYKRYKDFNAVRLEHANLVCGKKVTNGWSYFKANRNTFSTMLPTIYNSNLTSSKKLGLGYYSRSSRYEANKAFCDFTSQLPKSLPIVTMGSKESIESSLYNRPNWYHTYDNKDFFSKCSHYWYWKSKSFIDPLPHTLLEAIQAQCRIIIPNLKTSRDFSDGIDDLLSFLPNIDTTFNDSSSGYYCEGLDAVNWRRYMVTVVDNKLDHYVDTKYRSMYDWFCSL